MNFRVGDKVKVKQRLLSNLSSPRLIETLQRIGTIRGISRAGQYAEVLFSTGIWYNINKSDLELLKNHQYEFDFMV